MVVSSAILSRVKPFSSSKSSQIYTTSLVSSAILSRVKPFSSFKCLQIYTTSLVSSAILSRVKPFSSFKYLQIYTTSLVVQQFSQGLNLSHPSSAYRSKPQASRAFRYWWGRVDFHRLKNKLKTNEVHIQHPASQWTHK